MQHLKKIAGLILILIMFISISACSGSAKSTQDKIEKRTDKSKGMLENFESLQDAMEGLNDGSGDADTENTGKAAGDYIKEMSKLTDSIMNAKPVKMDNYSYEFIEMQDGHVTSRFKVWVKGSSTRYNVENGLDSGVEFGEGLTDVYIDNKTGKTYQYYSGENTAYKLSFQDLDRMEEYAGGVLDPSLFKHFKQTRTAEIDGKKCIVYEQNSEGEKEVNYLWEETGIKVLFERYADGKLIYSEHFKSLEIGKVDDAMLSIPSGAKLVDEFGI